MIYILDCGELVRCHYQSQYYFAFYVPIKNPITIPINHPESHKHKVWAKVFDVGLSQMLYGSRSIQYPQDFHSQEK